MPSLTVVAATELLKRKFLIWQSNYFVLCSTGISCIPHIVDIHILFCSTHPSSLSLVEGHLLRFASHHLDILVASILLRVPEAMSGGRGKRRTWGLFQYSYYRFKRYVHVLMVTLYVLCCYYASPRIWNLRQWRWRWRKYSEQNTILWYYTAHFGASW